MLVWLRKFQVDGVWAMVFEALVRPSRNKNFNHGKAKTVIALGHVRTEIDWWHDGIHVEAHP